MKPSLAYEQCFKKELFGYQQTNLLLTIQNFFFAFIFNYPPDLKEVTE